MDAILRPDTMADAFVPLASYVEHLSFEELYEREYPNLVAVAHALTGGFETGEDLVQDTMVKAYLNWSKIGRFERPGAWCLRVLTNACRSWLRRVRTSSRYVASLRRSDAMSDGPGPEFVAFWAAVRRLPSRPRLAVILYYVSDKPIAEIASILKVPEGTVKADLARSRTVLMAELGR
jgi:RNA polymerase sigma-70 factor (ECF subfamily)